MTTPSLPNVDLLVNELTSRLADPQSSQPPSLWHVTGPSSAGKSTLLRRLADKLGDAGLLPVFVSPPQGAPDAGPAALVEVGAALKECQAIDGKLDTFLGERSWPRKLEIFRGWFGEHGPKLVLLLDEPSAWPPAMGGEEHFAHRTRDIVRLLSAEVRCRKIITGPLSEPTPTTVTRILQPASEPVAWLSNTQIWGGLSSNAHSVRDVLGPRLASHTPLEIRLLVGLNAVDEDSFETLFRGPGVSRREISRHLANAISRKRSFQPLMRLWSKLSLVRRPFDEGILSALGVNALDSTCSNILRNCLLYSEGNQVILHDTLRSDARAFARLIPQREAAQAHQTLASLYKRRFEQLRSDPRAVRRALIEEMEAFHHASQSGDIGNLRTFFVDQLEFLGRTLSRDLRRYSDAVRVFERAVKWDAQEDYAHHYLAFNLDVQGIEPKRVEHHYREAIRLNPRWSWWRSRLISFLITRGRLDEARREWDDTLDVLGLPHPNADPNVYHDLHLWIARLLIHRGQLSFAEDVLNQIPKTLPEDEPILRAVQRRLAILLDVRKNGAVFPVTIPYERWWQGPHLSAQQHPNGDRLFKWIPGRVDAVFNEEVILLVAEPPSGANSRPLYGTLKMNMRVFEKSLLDEVGRRIVPGRFVELGYYGKAPKSKLVIRIHPLVSGLEPDLPPPFPDPGRYLKSRGRSS